VLVTATVGGDQSNQAGGQSRNSSSPVMPSSISDDVPVFDRFASAVAKRVSKAWFFIACTLLVVIWAPSFALFNIDTWQLIINTLTTIITFLLVALLQNTQKRADDALQHKLNAIADGLADLMRVLDNGDGRLTDDRRELLAAVGLEDREGGD
jgi:hypothetical protein